MIESTAEREMRGAAWCAYTEHAKSEFRARLPHRRADFHVGFRVVARQRRCSGTRFVRGGSFAIGKSAVEVNGIISTIEIQTSRRGRGFRVAKRFARKPATQRCVRGGSFNLGWPAHEGNYSTSLLGVAIPRHGVSFRPARRVR